MDLKKPSDSPVVVKRRKAAKERAAQRVRNWTVQNEMRRPETGVYRRCMKDFQFRQSLER